MIAESGKTYILIGAGGHARVLADAMRAAGIVLTAVASPDNAVSAGLLSGIRRMRSDDEVLALRSGDVLLINGVGSVGNPQARRAVFEKFQKAGFAFTSVVHPSAVIASHATMDEGAQVMAGAIVQTGARIGANAIINTGAIVDHDCQIGAHTHIAPGSCLAGDVIVGHSVHVGAGANVIQGKSIGDGVIVAAGAVVVSDIPPGITVAGVPARDIGRRSA
jgi:UDP-perosamine 4-acetyltransferase